MENDKEKKKAKLYDDEFNPHRAFRSFYRIPRSIARLENISIGAKLLYGALATYAGEYGTAYSLRDTLREALGMPSHKTLYNWQKELVNAGLIRVRQKGRGLPNNYYFLRTPILGNANKYEFDEGERCIYKGPQVKEPMVLSVDIAKQFFTEDVQSWFQRRIDGYDDPFPKPCWSYDRKWYKQHKETWEAKLADYFDKS